MDVLAIIPARYASSRFPGKPLADLLGKPMIERVYEQISRSVSQLCVATDDVRIFEAVRAFGGNVVMTRADHKSGTDRCYEAYCNLGSTADVVLNVQGDEPFVQGEQIEAILRCFDDASTQIATLVKPYEQHDDLEELRNPNNPKVVVAERSHEALYFSRSIVPFLRGVDPSAWLQAGHTFYRHIGMYAYRASVLREITALPMSPLERAESLEQLRWLENGYRIKVGVCRSNSIGIDTPQDLEAACVLGRQLGW